MNASSLCRLFSLALAGCALMACAAEPSEGDERVPSPADCEGRCEATVDRAVLPAAPARELQQEAPAYPRHVDARATQRCAGGVEVACDGRGTCWCPTTPIALP